MLKNGGKARITLHTFVTPADVMENQPMLDLLRRVIFRWRVRPKRIIADTTYGTIANIAYWRERRASAPTFRSPLGNTRRHIMVPRSSPTMPPRMRIAARKERSCTRTGVN